MKTTDRLKKEALFACNFRGHKMSRFKTVYKSLQSNDTVCEAICEKCKRYVQVNTHPAPNEIDICGDAVAVSCD